MMTTYATPQENFWAGEFGKDYIDRNQGASLLASNLNFFTHALRQSGPLKSCLEFGSNIGMNLKALQLLYPDIRLSGIEINPTAADQLGRVIGSENVFCGSIFDFPSPSNSDSADLVLIKGVLIHIAPDMLPQVYEKLYQSTKRFILLCEYYNPSPVSIPYRGHTDKLFKRDFAGDMLEAYNNLQLVDYGFCYRRDRVFPQDDATWFLLEKRS